MYTSNDFKIISQFYTYASDKQKFYIDSILRKNKPSAWDKQFLDNILRTTKVRMTNVSMTVDERMKRFRNTLKETKYKGSEI